MESASSRAADRAPVCVQVFATCGTPAKKAFLLEAFPGLKEENIGDSRSTSFEGVIRNRTQGRGVHLVLNSLSDDKLQVTTASWHQPLP